jgi:ribosomal protein S18 acetylase RimI-like enzyme
MIPSRYRIRLRPARKADGAEIAVMSRDLIEAGLGWRFTPRRVTACIRDRDTMVLVAEGHAQMAGFAIMEFGADTAHLVLLAVRPDRRRRGVARQLLRWLEKSARTAGITVVTLELRATNRGARLFYQAVGYRVVARLPGYYGRHEAALRMARMLNCSPPLDP